MTCLKIRVYIEGIFATALAIIAMSIFAKITWEAWDRFIAWLVSLGYSPDIELWLGLILFVTAISLGAIQLKKFKKKK